MNYFRTAVLLAGMTALFLGDRVSDRRCQGGMMMALLFAVGTNLFAYWNADKMVLRMYGARQVDAAYGAAVLHRHDTLALGAGGSADASRVYIVEERLSAQRLRHRPQSGKRRRRRDDRPVAAG